MPILHVRTASKASSGVILHSLGTSKYACHVHGSHEDATYAQRLCVEGIDG